MLKVIYCQDGQCVNDFSVYDFADMTIDCYLKTKKDVEVRVANALAQDVFVLRTLEGKLSPDEIEFYYENTKLVFDNELGLENPDDGEPHPNFYSKIAEAVLKIGYVNMRNRRMAAKHGKES